MIDNSCVYCGKDNHTDDCDCILATRAKKYNDIARQDDEKTRTETEKRSEIILGVI